MKNKYSRCYFEEDPFDDYDSTKFQHQQNVERLIKDYESFSVTDYEDLGFLVSEEYL